jgi:hypothetical protein
MATMLRSGRPGPHKTPQTWIAGSPALFVPHPLPPTVAPGNSPWKKSPTVAAYADHG